VLSINPLTLIEQTDDLDRAQRLLAHQEWDLLFVRHDIGREPRAAGDVVSWLCRHPAINPHLTIICHGANPVNDRKNALRARQASRPTWWLPFMIPAEWEWKL
jgi:hypothetical protein